jgi:GNAT superfamily N-acetyltransferase
MIINYTSELREDLLKMVLAMHAESRFKIFRFSDDKIAQLVQQPNVFCVLAKQEEKYIGFFIGVATDLWFSPDRAAYDLAFYIDPQHRGGFASVRMIHAFEDWAKKQKCSTINVGSSAEIATETARGLYQRLGYNECGFLAHKEI